MPAAYYPDEGLDSESNDASESNDQVSKSKSESPRKNNNSNNSSSRDESRIGRATDNTLSTNGVDRATGRQEFDENTYKAPFDPDKYGVLGGRQPPFNLKDKSGKSSSDRFSLNVDSRMPQSGLRTLNSSGKDEGSLRAHVYRVVLDSGFGLIQDGLTDAALGLVLGGFLGGPGGAAIGFGNGLLRGTTRGIFVEPVKGCVTGCHVLGSDERKGPGTSLIESMAKIDRILEQFKSKNSER